MIEAYFDCRHNKRNTMNALRFEIDYETECIRLWEEIEARRYEPNRSIAFVIEDPVKREIFAADFRDRVVHHIIARRIYPLLEKQFHPIAIPPRRERARSTAYSTSNSISATARRTIPATAIS